MDRKPENRPSKAGEVQGDGPRGTLVSPFFKIVGKRISFLIGGGCDIKKFRAEMIIDHQVRQSFTIAFSFVVWLWAGIFSHFNFKHGWVISQ